MPPLFLLFCLQLKVSIFARAISPTHEWTEGRAPVSGSEFTTKAAALQEGSAGIAPTPHFKFRDSVTGA